MASPGPLQSPGSSWTSSREHRERRGAGLARRFEWGALSYAFLAVSTLVATAAGPVAATAPPTIGLSASDTVLRVTFLNVGQGDAVLLQAPEGQTALIDAGRGNVVPLLREMGVERIDLLVATHPHADHIGGMAGVIASFPVRFFMDNGDPHTTSTYRSLIAALEARPGITYLEATPRTISLGSATLEVLPLLPRSTAGLNDRSVTLLVRFGNFTALFSGDSEVRQLDHLVGLGAVPALTLLKAPHHGSDNGFTWSFLRAARPRVVVISVGRNSYGHPRPAALDAYAATADELLRTDLHGHVEVRGREDGSFAVVRGDRVVSAHGGGRATVGAVRAGGRERTAVVATGVVSAASSHTGLRITVQADAPGNDHRNPNGEYVVVENTDAAATAIGGWRLCDLANHCFRFPPGAAIAGGGRIVVHSGVGRSDGERFYMGRRRAVWNNDGDTATLYDAKGATVVAFSY